MDIEYRVLTVLDTPNVVKYLKHNYPDSNTAIVRTLINKTISIGAFMRNTLVGCYLLDIDLYGNKGPEVTLKYIKVDSEDTLRPLLSAVSIFHTFNVELSIGVKDYLGVKGTHDLLNKYYMLEEYSITNYISTIDKKVIAKFKRGLQLEFYSSEDKEDLVELIREYHLERNSEVFVDDGSSLSTIREFLTLEEGAIREDLVILRCTRYNKIVGYFKYVIIDEYGSIPPYLYGEYIHVTKSYRKGMASTVLYGFTCYLSSSLGMYIKWDVYVNTSSRNVAVSFFKAEKYMEGYKLLPEVTEKFSNSLYLKNMLKNVE